MEDKRQKVLSAKGSQNKIYIGAGLAIIAIVAIFMLGSGFTGNITGAPSEVSAMDYSGIRVDKEIVSHIDSGDMVGVSLADLEEYRMLFFTHEDIPVLIYTDQHGGIVASIAMCEPCKNEEHFFIQNNQLVCGKCFTKWTLGTHQGISGGCKEYPPEIIEHVVKDGKVLVKKSDITNWRPRV